MVTVLQSSYPKDKKLDNKSHWYKEESETKKAVNQYYILLQKILRKTSKKERVLKSCCRCGILFLTTPSNRKRDDIRCPFGCRSFYDYLNSQYRSYKYYRTEKGKEKKKILNKCRYKKEKELPKKTEDSTESFEEDELFIYCRFIVYLFEKKKLKYTTFNKITNFFKKKRQLSLPFWLKFSKIII